MKTWSNVPGSKGKEYRSACHELDVAPVSPGDSVGGDDERVGRDVDRDDVRLGVAGGQGDRLGADAAAQLENMRPGGEVGVGVQEVGECTGLVVEALPFAGLVAVDVSRHVVTLHVRRNSHHPDPSRPSRNHAGPEHRLFG